MSQEHVIPRWVSKEIGEGPVTIHRSGVKDLTGLNVVNIVTKRVCKVCNESWMEQKLEDPVKPFLKPMIHGEQTTLAPAAQSSLAAWAAKVAMVGRYAHIPPQPLAAEWLDYMFQKQLAPESWYVWVTAYNGPRDAMYDSKLLNLSSPSRGVIDPNGVLMTLIVGKLAFKVLGIQEGTFRYFGSDPIPYLPFWPPRDNTATWPPQGGTLTEATLPYFVHWFLSLKPGETPPPLAE